MADEKPDCLYHYTTAEGLIGIVRNRELWATNVLYLNDRSEFRQGLQLAVHCLQSDEARQRLGNHADEIVEVLNTVGPSTPYVKLYVCCFSTDQDDLGQWRAYCGRGGYAIGFPFHYLDVPQSDQGVWLRQCVYDETDQLARIKEYTSTSNGTTDYLLDSLLKESVCFKHVAFRHEKEWRLIHAAPPTYLNDPEYRFRAYNGRIIPYTRIPLQDNVMWREVKVVVGPCPEAEMKESVAAVTSLLRYTAPSDVAKVMPSTIPYRHW